MTDTITICFYGSSDHELEVKLADSFEKDVDLIVDTILKVRYSKIKIITGGYGGIMNSISEKFANKRNETDKNIEIIGITCDAYDFENPDEQDYNSSNDYSIHNNVIIQSGNFADRVQSMIEMSDLFIVLPGKQGTLSELLFTCESYSYGKYFLNGKTTKVFTHEYWKPLLTSETFFRKFNTEILHFFSAKDFKNFIQTHTADTISAINLPNRNSHPIDNWEARIKELSNDICKVILGRVFDEAKLLERLSRDNQFPILGLDFGWFHTYNKKSKDGAYYSYSSQDYIDKTKEFFIKHNSIMLNDFKKDFDFDFIDGPVINTKSLKYNEGVNIPQRDGTKNDADFKKLVEYFNKEKYGQTLVWKGFKTNLGQLSNDHDNSEDADTLTFSIFLLLNHRIPRITIEKINQLLSDFLIKASAIKSGELFKEKDSNIINQATRAAISQVMARNTSHNIGAHVMNKLIGDLSKLIFNDFKNYTKKIEIYKPDTDNNTILLDQISIFNNYVKCRMDYLADISFGTPLMQTNKYAYAELFKELDKVRLLLEHISGLDNFPFEIKFTRNGKEFKKDNNSEGADDLLVAIPNDILGMQAFYNILENIIRNTAKHAQKNTAKYKTVFTVNFIDAIEVDNKKVVDYCEQCEKADCGKAHRKEIENALNEFIAVEVYDDIPVEGKPKELSEKEVNEYKRMMGDKIPDFEGYIDYLVFSQNSKLNEDILSENSKLRSYSLGLVEMDASAAYLRKRPVEYINHRSYDIQYDESWSRNTEDNKKEGRDEINHRGSNCRHFLKAFKKTEGDKNYLGYRFFLHRPAVVLVVTELLKDDNEKKEKLKKEGIWLLEPKEFEKELADGKVYPHEFVIHTDLKDCVTKIKIKDVETEVNLLEYFKTSLPIRILDVNNDDLNTILETNAEKIICDCWSRWFDKLRDKNQCSNHSNDHGELFYSIKGTYNEYACHSIVLIDHLYKEDGTQDIEKAKIIWCGLEGEKCHAEALSSLAQSKLPDYYKIVNQKCKNEKVGKELLKCYLNNLPIDTKEQIAESAFAKVVVIDERIQEAAQSRNFMTIKFDKLYDKMNVIIPKKDVINLSANSYDTALINKLNKYLGLPLEGNEECNEIENATIGLNSSDFMLIHYSIFERMFKKEDINGKLEDIAKRGINVVVTSGRGTPENLTPKARFVNLSSVINSFVDIRSKYLINYLLNSSRKSNKI